MRTPRWTVEEKKFLIDHDGVPLSLLMDYYRESLCKKTPGFNKRTRGALSAKRVSMGLWNGDGLSLANIQIVKRYPRRTAKEIQKIIIDKSTNTESFIPSVKKIEEYKRCHGIGVKPLIKKRWSEEEVSLLFDTAHLTAKEAAREFMRESASNSLILERSPMSINLARQKHKIRGIEARRKKKE